VGAAVGKGRGILAVPLTYDSETVLAFIDSLDALGITGRGTNLESLIDAASGAFQDSIPSRRGIILFSDGEALSGSLQAGLEKIRAPGIILSVLGLGSDEGGPVPVEKSPDAPGGVLLDADGSPVISVRQGDSLRAAAEKSGGIFIDGSRNDAAAVLADYVNSLSAESGLSGHRREANPQWRIFVIAAMVCLGGARVMGFGRRNNPPKSGGRGKSGIQVLLCLAALLDSSCTRTQGKLLIMEGNFFYSRGFYTEAVSFYLRALDYGEAVPYAEYGLGAAYFALEEGNAALARYQAAEKGLFEHGGEAHSELRYRIYYNMGIIHFEQGDYTKAADAFREALKIDGSRIEAKRNLELSLLTVARTGVPPGLSPSPATDAGREGTGADNSVLFDYLRRKEQDQWKSREWSGEDDFSGPDY
jgi:Ca-activated chloride channel family protein